MSIEKKDRGKNGHDSGLNDNPQVHVQDVHNLFRKSSQVYGFAIENQNQTLRDIPPGYSSLAAFVAFDEDNAIFRRFQYLHSRVLLHYQAQIELNERRLQKIDNDELEKISKPDASGKISFSTDNQSWHNDKNEERRKVLEDIRILLKNYDEDLFRYKELLALPEASKRQRNNIRNWMKKYTPLAPDESHFHEDIHDLVFLGKEDTDMVNLSEPIVRFLRFIFGWLCCVCRKKKPAKIADDKDFRLENKNRKKSFISIIFATIVAGIMTSGVLALYFVQTDRARLIVLSVATLLCSLVLATLTTAKRGEIFGATAAYCAVLVVFVGSTLEKNNGLTAVKTG